MNVLLGALGSFLGTATVRSDYSLKGLAATSEQKTTRPYGCAVMQSCYIKEGNCEGVGVLPIVVSEGRFTFVIYTSERLTEPPHVHVFEGEIDICRINLDAGTFMGPAYPPQEEGTAISQEYRKYALTIRRAWDQIHPVQGQG